MEINALEIFKVKHVINSFENTKHSGTLSMRTFRTGLGIFIVKAKSRSSISWEGHLIGNYDALLQSGKGTQRLTVIKDGEHWRAGEEIEQLGIIQRALVDVLGSVIKEVRR